MIKGQPSSLENPLNKNLDVDLPVHTSMFIPKNLLPGIFLASATVRVCRSRRFYRVATLAMGEKVARWAHASERSGNQIKINVHTVDVCEKWFTIMGSTHDKNIALQCKHFHSNLFVVAGLAVFASAACLWSLHVELHCAAYLALALFKRWENVEGAPDRPSLLVEPNSCHQ